MNSQQSKPEALARQLFITARHHSRELQKGHFGWLQQPTSSATETATTTPDIVKASSGNIANLLTAASKITTPARRAPAGVSQPQGFDAIGWGTAVLSLASCSLLRGAATVCNIWVRSAPFFRNTHLSF